MHCSEVWAASRELWADVLSWQYGMCGQRHDIPVGVDRCVVMTTSEVWQVHYHGNVGSVASALSWQRGRHVQVH